jgi:hypothetical protein
LAQNWKKHLVHPKKRQTLGLALGPAEGAALGLALVPAAEGARQGLNRSKLISRQEFIRSKWLPTAEMQITELASIPAFVHSHTVYSL